MHSERSALKEMIWKKGVFYFASAEFSIVLFSSRKKKG